MRKNLRDILGRYISIGEIRTVSQMFHPLSFRNDLL
jgi:hypothetical protein